MRVFITIGVSSCIFFRHCNSFQSLLNAGNRLIKCKRKKWCRVSENKRNAEFKRCTIAFTHMWLFFWRREFSKNCLILSLNWIASCSVVVGCGNWSIALKFVVSLFWTVLHIDIWMVGLTLTSATFDLTESQTENFKNCSPIPITHESFSTKKERIPLTTKTNDLLNQICTVPFHVIDAMWKCFTPKYLCTIAFELASTFWEISMFSYNIFSFNNQPSSIVGHA